ncbi:hypothetical protein CK203_059101 [Vitis vinifera]|uniref:Uncharacterized protein n=1 Tax=Vitis vinifera TaxID=29760 RepID=A0A438GTS0_VITVI|nr:hypothetical protein CK203_059101 [Vitis vinifera]
MPRGDLTLKLAHLTKQKGQEKSSVTAWRVLVKVRFTKASDQGQYRYSHVKTCGIMINKSKNSYNYRIMDLLEPITRPRLCGMGGRKNEKKHTYLPISLSSNAQASSKKARKITKGLSLVRGKLGKENPLINWEVVCTQKEKGGLGIRKIDLLNKALLGKWIWRFALEKKILWKKVIGVKYGHEGFGWRTNEARGTFGVGVWKEILKDTNWCWDNIGFKGGEGLRSISGLISGVVMRRCPKTFPQLFALAVQRNATVNEMWDSSLGQGEEDSVIWKGGGHGSFWIRDAYKLSAAPSAITFPKKSIWVDKVPTKVVFFAWRPRGRRS